MLYFNISLHLAIPVVSRTIEELRCSFAYNSATNTQSAPLLSSFSSIRQNKAKLSKFNQIKAHFPKTKQNQANPGKPKDIHANFCLSFFVSFYLE